MPAAIASRLPHLNSRQQLYLRALYHLDQEQEEEHHDQYVRGLAWLPAAEWRLLPYGRWKHLAGAPATPLRQLIEQHQVPGQRLVDPGAGSTWKALAARGLVEMEERVIVSHPDPRIGYSLPHIRLTRLGRRLVRHLLGAGAPTRPAPARPVKGLLTRPVWEALCQVYQQDADGVGADPAGALTYGSVSHYPLHVLHGKGLVASWPLNSYSAIMYHKKYLITEQGRSYYAHYYRLHAATYADVLAELPRPVLPATDRLFWQQVPLLRQQRAVAGPDQNVRDACRRHELQLRLAQRTGTSFVEPYWYPLLAGRSLATVLHRHPEMLRASTAAEALALLNQARTRWQRQLAALRD